MREVVDTITDADGDGIEVSVEDELVSLRATTVTGRTDLDLDGQERFAKAYVTACRQAEANRAEAGEVSDGG